MEQILLSSSEVSLAKSHATLMELGGKSFRDKDSRKENLSLDQLVGALGEMAFSIYLTGSKHAWELTRRARNTCVGVGDDGATVNLMGWAEREVLPLSPNSSGTFAGAYSLPANGLNRLPSFRWLGDKSNAVRHEDNRSDEPN